MSFCILQSPTNSLYFDQKDLHVLKLHVRRAAINTLAGLSAEAEACVHVCYTWTRLLLHLCVDT